MSATSTLDLIALGVDDRPWAMDGACRRYDSDLFFPASDESAEHAKRVCLACPVIEECREWALETGVSHGIWGGLTERERRRWSRRIA